MTTAAAFTPHNRRGRVKTLSVIQIVMMAAASVVVLGSSPSLADPTAGKRHAYIHAIPFKHMKLAAPVLTSLTDASPRQCGLRCLHLAECQSVNYRWAARSCDLLGDYLCSDLSELVYAGGYRHYDVEKNGVVEVRVWWWG